MPRDTQKLPSSLPPGVVSTGTKTCRARAWVFTMNNYLQSDWNSMCAINGRRSTRIQYIIMSKEKGASGTPHIQGYVQFKMPVRMTTVKKLLKKKMWCAVARADYIKNKKYITKQHDRAGYEVYEWGEPSKQGDRRDLDDLRELVKSGMSRDAITTTKPTQWSNCLRYHAGIDKAISAFMLPRGNEPTKGVWFWGTTGAGKSWDAIRLAASIGSIYYKSDSTKWWPNYNGEDVVIYDDIRAGAGCPAASILRLLDRGAHTVEYKGGNYKFRSTVVIFTSPKEPMVFWGQGYPGEDSGQLLRRLNLIVEYQGFITFFFH